MSKSLSKSLAQPGAEVIAAIAASDKVSELQAATFRFQAKMAELERKYAEAASALRGDFLHECEEIHQS